jgi:hypothetical protein
VNGPHHANAAAVNVYPARSPAEADSFRGALSGSYLFAHYGEAVDDHSSRSLDSFCSLVNRNIPMINRNDLEQVGRNRHKG